VTSIEENRSKGFQTPRRHRGQPHDVRRSLAPGWIPGLHSPSCRVCVITTWFKKIRTKRKGKKIHLLRRVHVRLQEAPPVHIQGVPLQGCRPRSRRRMRVGYGTQSLRKPGTFMHHRLCKRIIGPYLTRHGQSTAHVTKVELEQFFMIL
jgi:hypothetical protein